MRLVKDVMITDVVTISPFAKMREALSLMKRHKIKSLVVDKQNQHDAFGLITYSDILKTVIAEEGDIDLLNVYDICAKPVIAVGEELAIQHVAKLMTTHRVKRTSSHGLPVTYSNTTPMAETGPAVLSLSSNWLCH